jgi:hypothetical protein
VERRATTRLDFPLMALGLCVGRRSIPRCSLNFDGEAKEYVRAFQKPSGTLDGSEITRASSDYSQWTAEVAHSQGVFFIDLNEIVAKQYEAQRPLKVKELYFLEDHTHTTPAGAQLNAASIVEGLRSFKNCSLAAFLLKKTVGQPGKW